MDTFDFDTWSNLAQLAPEDFERNRLEAIEYVISQSRDVNRLRGLQCRIDFERIRAKTSMKACIEILSLMWNSFFSIYEISQIVSYGEPTLAFKRQQPTTTAKVIPN